MVDDVGTTRTATVGPPLQPPLLEVGYNYTWPFNRYGTTIGPRDLENDPPTGVNDAAPVFAASLGRNLAILRDELKIKKVRMFLLANAFNYGRRPTAGTSSGRFFFTAPPSVHPTFLTHFRAMLQAFQQNEMQIVPSLIDFGAFYPLGQAGGGRTSILTSQRTTFIETVLKPLLAVSQEPGLASTIFAWEIVNEPFWNTVAFPFFSRPHTSSSGPDIGEDVMATFISDCLAAVRGAGFKSTVGHRFFADLKSAMPTGDLPQYHYYGRTFILRAPLGIRDPNPIPTLADIAGDPRTRDAFVGEFAVAPGGDKNQFGDEEPGSAWPECNGRDTTRANAAFERLAVLARKGYKLAFAWPDRSDKEDGVRLNDELKLTDDAKAAIKRFTTGRFPNGIP